MNRAARVITIGVVLSSFLALLNPAVFGMARQSSSPGEVYPLCQSNSPLCTEVMNSLNYEGVYTGHDEPSVMFYSNTAGSGNSNSYTLTLPKDPPTLPKQDGSGGTYNFQLRPAFWFGMAMCDTQSAPEYTTRCAPDSDLNVFDSPDPSSSKYMGHHPGGAYMEMQFYPPGWVNWPAGNSCGATTWCAALNIDSYSYDQNNDVYNNLDCQNRAGVEYVNFAFITKDGKPHAPPNPLDATLFTFTPNPTTDLLMNSGDTLVVQMNDSPNGFQVVIHDVTTGDTGYMTASAANLFAQVNFQPSAPTCSITYYDFHPMYATSGPHTRLTWTAHSYNVAFSDEIGHFEYCNGVTGQTGDCTVGGINDGGVVDSDDYYCLVPGGILSGMVHVTGCLGTDLDFDGMSYQHAWPGSLSDPFRDAQLNPQTVRFTSPLFNGTQNYDRVAFETDLPRIEATDLGGPCNRTTGEGCVNPPPGANFYPIYSTGTAGGKCVWQLGGNHIPGSTDTFGGNSTAEFGPLLLLTYPTTNTTTISLYEDFRRVLTYNPCMQ